MLNTAFKIVETTFKFKFIIGLALFFGALYPPFKQLRRRLGNDRYGVIIYTLLFAAKETFNTILSTIFFEVYLAVDKIFNTISPALGTIHKKFTATLIRENKPLIYQKWKTSLPQELLV